MQGSEGYKKVEIDTEGPNKTATEISSENHNAIIFKSQSV